MNKHDIEVLRANWELKREQFKGDNHKRDMDISSSCYVSFGTYGAMVFKYIKGKWHRKTVNDWKTLNFDEFLKAFNAQEWEA